jgi:uncharacterized DUF497 family protein
MAISFHWHGEKAKANLTKHGVSFQEAATVFADPLAAIFPDEKHSINEIRELIIGHSSKKRLLIVSFTERRTAIRIISARRATRKERKDYEERPNSE